MNLIFSVFISVGFILSRVVIDFSTIFNPFIEINSNKVLPRNNFYDFLQK